MTRIDVPSQLLDRARQLATTRTILGIAGAPGAGKSTLAHAIQESLGESCVVVGMDGFHYTNDELVRLGRRDRKGAPDTFDAHGYISLLQRIRTEPNDIYAPAYQRGIGNSIASAIRIPSTATLVITEGNYLLMNEEPWAGVKELLDESWFVEVNENLRISRLIERHVASGKDPDAAKAWSLGPDQANAEIIAKTRDRADRIVTLD
ncbi:nucleoside/nucleotide kinase family protein [Flaviflexus massiliensis]|uniref:nucleoside/nucleotide kinase family protein n=1 Tax=Flaviflexus massiliensis TaxID=1522309 RepID=UPI0006D58054|nr:nucleoside/nucleotide kinase family protein [Flaviflexus massiliensis]